MPEGRKERKKIENNIELEKEKREIEKEDRRRQN